MSSVREMIDIEISERPVIHDIDNEDRPCHIDNRRSGISMCGLRHVSQGVIAHGGGAWRSQRRFCRDNHQMCVVCLAEYERCRGRSYFEGI
jgi:hypothetical protein